MSSIFTNIREAFWLARNAIQFSQIEDQIVMDREQGQLEPVRHAHLVVDFAEMMFDSVFADRQRASHLLVRIAGAHLRNNLELALRETEPLDVLRRLR